MIVVAHIQIDGDFDDICRVITTALSEAGYEYDSHFTATRMLEIDSEAQ